MRRSVLVVAITAACLVATACGSPGPPRQLDVSGVERAIEHSIQTQHGIVTAVRCPAAVPQQSGFKFSCSAVLDVGRYAIAVVEFNNRGGVRYSSNAPIRVLDSRSVASAIETAVRRQRHLHATVSCPKLILQQKGLRFACQVTTNKGTGAFSVFETDNSGHVRFRGN